MKSLKLLSLAITMLCCFLSFSQEKTITKNVLLNNFKSNKGLKNRHWNTCNNDSLFYKSDTIYFYEESIHHCKKFIIWNFINRKKFYQIEGTNYGNHSGLSLASKNNLFNIKIHETENQLIINVYIEEKYIASYLVIDFKFDENENKNKLTLLKKKTITF